MSDERKMRQRDSDGWEPLNPVERAMAKRMAAAVVPMAAQWIDVRVDRSLAAVAQLKNDGVPATFNALVVHAVLCGLRDHPEVGAELDYENYRRRLPDSPGIGVAVMTKRGLVVPVFRSSSTSRRDIAIELDELVSTVREGAAPPHVFHGGNFTISNIGDLGIHGGFPTPNPPQPAILGVASVREMPVVEGGAVVVGKVSTFTLALDHRGLDGVTAARFFRQVTETVEG